MPRAGVTPEAVLEAAQEIADTEGLEAVTLTRVATRLGVRPPSLYNHVDGLAGIHLGLAERALRLLHDRLLDAAAGRTRDEAVVAVAAAYRQFAHDHPGLYAASLPSVHKNGASVARETADAIIALLARLVGAYGLCGDEALHAVRAWRAVLHGFASLELARGFGMPLEVDTTHERLIGLLTRGLESWTAA